MSNIAFINAISLSPYAREKLGEGPSAFERVLGYVRQLPEVEKIVLLTDIRKDEIQAVEQDVRNEWNLTELLAAMKRRAQGFSHLFYVYADCPFLDVEVTRRMYANHRRYFADYSFADGFPYGLTPEILSTESIDSVNRLAAGIPLERDALFEAIKKDINAFDIETELSPSDLRLLRVSLTADRKRNFMLVNGVLGAGGSDAPSVLRQLQDRPDLLRTIPAFFNVQIVEGCPQNCSYCPYPGMRGPEVGKQAEMSLDDYGRLVKAVKAFCEDAVISVSLWGEAALHSSIERIAQCTLENPGLDMIIETSGIGWPEGTLQRIGERCPKPPRWVVSLDAHDREMYRALRGEGFDEALRTVRILKENFPGGTYVQAVRMQENEDDLEEFFRHWKGELGNVIIQKYDDFSGKLPDKKVTDLSPLKRFPCWHIKRDMTVLLDGRVVLCREDLDRSHVLGNVLQDDLEEIWKRGAVLRPSSETRISPNLRKLR